MAYKRGDTYHLKRRLPGVGLVRRTLETENQVRADQLEGAITELARRGHLDLIRAFSDGTLSAHELHEAQAAGTVHELEAALREGPTPTLAEAWADVLRLDAADVASSTRERYETSYAHIEAFHGADSPVDEALTDDAVKAFKARRIKKGVAKQTINNDLAVVSLLATRALDKGWIDRRPKIKRYKYRPRMRHLEPDELREYMKHLTPEYRPLMRLLVGSGLRLGEALGPRDDPPSGGLRKADVQDNRLRVRTGKTDGATRSVSLADWLATELAKREPGPDGRLFPHVRRDVQDAHSEACEAAKIEDYMAHDHRHTYAVSMARAGMPLGILQQQLGHKTIAMTMRYASFHPDYQDTAPYEAKVAKQYGFGAAEGGDSIGGDDE